ncbi:hypothetical protein SDC9_166480 [bioreactor metagenome]|uniref:IPTL-CTERM protein sorting domain-containing protein n=1 Tax=bioreactor metagenome TaxID=1076179 RepID=A0A645G4P9_9ZZZZ
MTVNAGDTVTWTAVTDLACGDLVVNGSLTADGASFTNVGSVIIGSTGSMSAAGTTFNVNNGWSNSGSFSGAGSTVVADSACSNTSTTFTGNTPFANLRANIAGHTLNFAPGSEQTVSGQLALDGVTLLGQGGTAYLTLLPGGTQTIATVGVNDVNASRGQHLAPTAVNVITGPAVNWFSAGPKPPVVIAQPVPVTGPWGLALMAGLLMAAAHRTRRQSRKSPHGRTESE